MKTEFLKELGLHEEQIQAIMRENGRDIEGVRSKFAGYDTLKEKAAKWEKSTADQNLVAQLQEEVRVWKEKTKEVETTWKQKLDNQRREDLLDRALQKAGARSQAAVRSLLREDQMSLSEDGVLSGLEEQLSALKTQQSYLFGADQVPPKILRPASGFLQAQEDSRIREVMGLPIFAQGKDDF